MLLGDLNFELAIRVEVLLRHSITMGNLEAQCLDLNSFNDWRQSLNGLSARERRFDEWFFLNAATVVIGEKTGELLACDLSEFLLERREIESCLDRLSSLWGVRTRMLYESNGFLKLIVFDEQRLAEVLDQAPYCVMGVKLKYEFPLRPDAFLGEVEARWNDSGVLPHEIGVALGYPLDDVFGYMGLLPLSCKGVCGWQVYGCMKKATHLSCGFNQARCQALVLLSQAATAA